jgi:hypothetical protein
MSGAAITLPDLDPTALEAAKVAFREEVQVEVFAFNLTVAISKAIRAYLAARSTVPEAGKAVVWLPDPIGVNEIWQTVYDSLDLSEDLRTECADEVSRAIAKTFSSPASVPAPSGAEPAPIRNDEFGFVEFINQDVPYIVREIDGHVAILHDMETRAVIGYRVYDPAKARAVPADDIAGLVERLKDHYRTDVGMASETGDDTAQAIAALTSLSAERDEAMAKLAVEVKGSSESYKLYLASEAEAASLRRKLEEAREALRVIATSSGYEWSETREQLHRIIDAAVECANNALRTLSGASE